MAIAWGSYENHLRVGVDYVINPSAPGHADTTVNVTWKFYVGTDNWNWNDNQDMHEGATGWGGTTTSFTNNLGPNGSRLIHSVTRTYGISYASGNVSGNCNITGAYNGATPSKSRTITLPNRPPGTPLAPSTPVASGVGNTSATISWSAPSNEGATIDAYELQVDTGAGFVTMVYDVADGAGSPTLTRNVTGLSPNTTYYFRSRAHNGMGWGLWSPVGSLVTTASGPTTPGTPTLQGSTATSLDVAWATSDPNGGTGLSYTCEIATGSGFGGTIIATYSGSVAGTTFTGLTASTTYYVRVRATASNGTSANSATLTQATPAGGLYNDAGDLVSLIGNLAGAVGEKMVHLGNHMFAEKTTTNTLTAATQTAIAFNSTVSTMGPDNPTRSGGTLTAHYPGEYLIEFGFRFDEAASTGHNGLTIKINGTVEAEEAYAAFGVATAKARVLSISRRLAAGDTLDFEVIADAAQTNSGGGRYAWARVVMTGF